MAATRKRPPRPKTRPITVAGQLGRDSVAAQAALANGRPDSGLAGPTKPRKNPAAAVQAPRPPDASNGSFWRLGVAQRQRILRDAGYHVAVDGISGPQTFTASKAYVKGISADYWNHAWAKGHPIPSIAGVAPAATDASSSGPISPVKPPPVRKPAAAAAPQPSGWEQLVMQMLTSALHPAAGPSDAALMKQAGSYADAQLAPYQAELKRQQDEAIADAERRASFQRDAASALAHIVEGIGPTINNIYQQGAAETGELAKGFSSALQNMSAASAQNVNETLGSVVTDAPAGQRISGEGAQAAGDVAYALGGFIPGSTMAREGSAFGSAAAFLPNTMLGMGQRQASAELDAGTKTKKELNQQLLDLALKRPDLVQQFLASARDSAAKTAALNQENALLPLMLAGKLDAFPGVNPITGLPTKTQAQLTQAGTKAKLQFEIQLGNQKIQLARLNLATRKTLASITGTDPITGQLTPEGQRILLEQWKATHPAQKGGYTQKQLSDKRARAGAIAHDAFFGLPETKADAAAPPLTYQEAMREILNAGVPLSIAQKALNTYWTQAGADRTWELKDGEYVITGWTQSPKGRPRTPFQVRTRTRTSTKRK
jgi:hypothetical protein